MKKSYMFSSIPLVLALFLSFMTFFSPKAIAASDPLLGNPIVHQIGFVVKDIDKASTDYAKLFGIKKPAAYDMGSLVTNSKFHGQSVGFDHKATFIDTSTIQIELLQPGNEPSTIGEFLANSGEGVHHTSIAVNDIQGKSALLESMGAPVVQTGDIMNDGGYFSFIDTSYMYKTMLELVEIKTTPPFPPNEPAGAPLLGTNKIAQLGFVVNNLDQAAGEYAKLLGVDKPSVVTDDRFKSMIFHTPTVDIELIEPDQTGNIWRKHLKSKGEGVYHLAFEVDNLKKSIDLLQKMGYPMIQTGVTKSGTKYAYMDTTSSFKVIFKLMEKKS
ncbi:Glyoxalase/Bleomycin resistance protein/Dioxygenase superfamily protein [Seinonella peptonophila]|uniref:Glyoxalase/Bleomycin resistance protein/Dioxygenase superfamily protein n=1 Tax=Seinonella peptonophila TaxID=112248 RepID=A0A1M4Y6R3_9BACL|nr:VOC family protein [Seinonella peptonophila]SHF01360.1 Glyoxalase/Bleomycin resistance protein/Dioxygenase superfamily protein [Seinonella peptonophila]